MVREGARRRGARGATLVEYALVLALLVVASVGSIEYLEDETGDEVDNQANCISERPPPPSCQVPPATPASGPHGPGGSGDPGGGGAPGSYEAALAPPVVSASPSGDRFDVQATYVLMDTETPPAPIADQVVTAQITVRSSTFPNRIGRFFYADCVSQPDGTCTFSFSSRWPDVEELAIEIVAVGIDTPYSHDREPDPDAVVSRPPASP